MSQEDIVNRVYQFLVEMIPRLEKLPRSQKFLIADRLESMILDLLQALTEAYYTTREPEVPKFTQAKGRSMILRLLIP